MKSRSAYLVLGIGLVLVTAWLGMLLWNAGHPVAAVGAARPEPPAHYVLTDSQGRAITEHSFPGRLRLVFLGFASCADVCPATLAKFRPALAALGDDADRVQPLFISVDPDRDTPERLARYVQGFDAHILGATGSPAQLRAFARSYGVYVNVDGHGAGSIVYSVTHTSSLLLIGPDGALLGVIDSRVPAVELAARLRQQLRKTYSANPSGARSLRASLASHCKSSGTAAL
jgi:protein SCO1